LSELTGAHPVSITDNEIAFFLLAKNPAIRNRLVEIVAKYANTYPMLRSCAGD
jgi:hypothetical protein